MEIIVRGREVNDTEKQAYVDYLEDRYSRRLQLLEIQLDGDHANLKYEFQPEPFERIRRITGYLTGNLDTWNNAKRAEESERAKHGVQSDFELM